MSPREEESGIQWGNIRATRKHTCFTRAQYAWLAFSSGELLDLNDGFSLTRAFRCDCWESGVAHPLRYQQPRFDVAKPLTYTLSQVDSLFYLAAGVIFVAAVAGFFLR